MASEKYSNGPQSTLNGAINNSTTTLVVADASAFPATGQFRILVDSEIMLVTTVSGNTFTVTRGVESTTAASHSDGVLVTNIMTAGAFTQIFADNCQSDTTANRPAAERAGRLFLANDGPLQRDNGGGWDIFQQPWWISKFTAPPTGTFTWVNQGSATVVESTNKQVLTQVQNAGVSLAIRKKALASSSPYTLTAAFSANIPQASSSGCAILLRNSGTGKLILQNIDYSTSLRQFLYPWNSPTSVGTASVVANATANPWLIWYRIVDDGTNRVYYTSVDGNSWIRMTSELRTNFITPDECGFGVYANQNVGQAIMTLLSWKETNP